MDEGLYLNFDLIIERVGENYRARVFDSPAGQASAEFGNPFSELELENLVLRMGRSRSGVRRVDSSEMEAVKQCGQRLFQAVFSENVYACFLRSRDASVEENKGLRLRLHIDVPEFHDYPWEFLFNPNLNQFLTLSKHTPVVRYLELPYPVKPLSVKPPLKILVMISSPDGYPKLNVKEEWNRLSKSLSLLNTQKLVHLEQLPHPTLSTLQQFLRLGEYHIFHFIGHGKFSERKQDGMLLLEDEKGKGLPVSGQYLGTVLHDHRSLRLVVLNACEGARTSQEDPYAGVAQTLLLQGIPAVIAMQFEVLESAAITFAQEFYGSVADGYPVDAALSEARKAIFASGNDVEWGTPVLYMRTPQGIIFDIPEGKIPRKRLSAEVTTYVDEEFEKRLDQLYTEGLAAFWVEDWDKACDRFQRILKESPDHAGATEKLGEARRKRTQILLYTRAVEAEQRKKWSEALDAIDELLANAPDYKDAQAFKSRVQKQKQLTELYFEAKQVFKAEKWQAVVKIFEQIMTIDPDFDDSDELLPAAKKEVEKLNQEDELRELYNRAVHSIDSGEWQEAYGCLKQIQDSRPDFLETNRLLSKVEGLIEEENEEKKRQEKIQLLYDQARALSQTGKWREVQNKIKEIVSIDEHFEDHEKLAEKARQALIREEEEIEKNNKLVALYNESVKLNNSAKYQEALEKWDEIVAIDPKYPDKQKVQRTALKKLSSLGKDSAYRWFNFSKPVLLTIGGLIGIIGIIGIAAIVSNQTAPILPAISRQPTSSRTVVSTDQPASSSATEKSTATRPSPTRKPSATSPPPTATIDADPSVYDNFNNPDYDGKFNFGRWTAEINSGGSIIQNDGTLELTQKGLGSSHLEANFWRQDQLSPIKTTLFQAEMKLNPTSDFGYVLLSIEIGDSEYWCAVYYKNVPSRYCNYSTRQRSNWSEDIVWIESRLDTWYLMAIEVDMPNRIVVVYFDNQQVGSHLIPENEPPEFNVSLSVGSFTEKTVTGYVDNFRIVE